ncbi:predicted protein, partial [Nematostella vectensis]
IKYLSLAILAIQNASLILTIRYSRTIPGELYIASTVVAITEVVKGIVSLVVMLWEKKDPIEWLKYVYSSTFGQTKDMMLMAVPALIYTVQNNLQYVAISNLDAAVFQVTYQLKILSTALMSVLMLKKHLSKMQWFSLMLLFVGVSIVQLQDNGNQLKTHHSIKQNSLLGLAAVVASCICSGFAGVYFEKTLKATQTPLWARNLQLAFFGAIIALLGVAYNDGAAVKQKGFFFGYGPLVYGIVFSQVFGGLLVGIVVKYADNILKGFAAAVAIVLSCIMSVYMFGFKLSVEFVSGASLVIIAIVLYS